MEIAKITLVNRQTTRILGYTEDEMIGKNWIELLIPEEQRERVAIVHADFLIGKSKVIEYYENQLIGQDGEHHHIAWNNTFQHDANGNVIGTLSSGRDITAYKNAEAALITAKADAEEANDAKSQFLTSMSHELRTPLNAVLGFAQFLQLNPDKPLSTVQNDHVESILAGGGNHLLELINEILDLSRTAQVDQIAEAWRKERDMEILHQLRNFLRELWIVHALQEDIKIVAYTEGKERIIRKVLKDLK